MLAPCLGRVDNLLTLIIVKFLDWCLTNISRDNYEEGNAHIIDIDTVICFYH
jgi:hypothetical protein